MVVIDMSATNEMLLTMTSDKHLKATVKQVLYIVLIQNMCLLSNEKTSVDGSLQFCHSIHAMYVNRIDYFKLL